MAQAAVLSAALVVASERVVVVAVVKEATALCHNASHKRSQRCI